MTLARILLTGGSSFTGFWIAKALAQAGYEVIAPVTRHPGGYEGLRAERVERLAAYARVVFEAPFGSPAFLTLITDGVDLLAHHAADIPNYRSPNYDVVSGVGRNLAGAERVLSALADVGATGVIVTGTTFEVGEGGPAPHDMALSPYGLSKTLTSEALRHFALWRGLKFGKFVIAAPFGPFEEGRFAWSLFQRWFVGQPGHVKTPRYIRDNIPAPLLGQAYASLSEGLLESGGPTQLTLRPSGIVGTQEFFANVVANEMRSRLGLACDIELSSQLHFVEPEVCINTDCWIPRGGLPATFWDAYAAYYERVAANGRLSSPA